MNTEDTGAPAKSAPGPQLPASAPTSAVEAGSAARPAAAKRPRQRNAKPSAVDTSHAESAKPGRKPAAQQPRARGKSPKPGPPARPGEGSLSAVDERRKPAARDDGKGENAQDSAADPGSRRQRSRAGKERAAASAASSASANVTSDDKAAAGKARGRRKPNPGAKAAATADSNGRDPAVAETPQNDPTKPKLSRRAKAALAKQARRSEPSTTPSTPKSHKQKGTAKQAGGRIADSGSASQQSGAWLQLPATAHAETRLEPATKVCVRWLPADLPEHVFWRSAEPALPWFDPGGVREVTQKERPILAALASGADESNADDGSLAAQTAPEDPHQQPENTKANATDSQVISPRAPTKLRTVDVYDSPNLARLDDRPYWRQFVPGKQHRSKAKSPVPSRAYIVFAAPAEAEHFYRRYHGHTFSKNGAQTRAVVEMAPLQSVGWLVNADEDPLEATIDSDPDFQAFLALQASTEDGSGAARNGKASSHTSYAAAAASPSETGGSAPEATATPLIKYLRELKSKQRSKGSSKSARKADAGPPKILTRSEKGSAPKKPKEGAPKKSRRQNR
ncbi:hypothetical protein H4S02_000663 [Coemansia sp. RSA 2611]|nr:hypothetical protein H4S02_000663 [Coemansia sp. RSA 2611]